MPKQRIALVFVLLIIIVGLIALNTFILLKKQEKAQPPETLEGPELTILYRGKAQLVNGETIIELPEDFEALAKKEGRTVFLTPRPESEDEPVSNLVDFPIEDGKFKVIATDQNNPNQKFFWEVKAVQADAPPSP